MPFRSRGGVVLLAMVGLLFTTCAEAELEEAAEATPETVVRTIGADLTGVEIDVHQAVG